LTKLVDNIKTSGGNAYLILGMPTDWAPTKISSFLGGGIKRLVPSNSFQWNKLPTISFEISTAPGGSSFEITLGPKQYFQQDDEGFWFFVIGKGSDYYAVLGIPFFNSFYVMIDRAAGTVGFALGCG
jgi:hypothetical protein